MVARSVRFIAWDGTVKESTHLGSRGRILRSTTLNLSRPKTLNSLSTTASSADLPIRAVLHMCHELATLVEKCS